MHYASARTPPSPTCCRPCGLHVLVACKYGTVLWIPGNKVSLRSWCSNTEQFGMQILLQLHVLAVVHNGSQNCWHQSYPLNHPLFGPFQCSGLIEVSSCWDGIQWNRLRTYCNMNFRGWIAGFNPSCQLFEIRTLRYFGILGAGSFSPLTATSIPNIDH